METLTRVLKYGTNDFFNFIRNIDYGYMDVKGKIHRISPNDDYSKQGGEPYVFSSPDQVVANNCGWCWDVAELIRLWCQTNNVKWKYIFFEYLSNDFHKTHTQVFAKWNNKWCECPDNTSPIVFGENCYDKFETCINDFVNLFKNYLKNLLGNKYVSSNLLVKEIIKPLLPGMSVEEYLETARKY